MLFKSSIHSLWNLSPIISFIVTKIRQHLIDCKCIYVAQEKDLSGDLNKLDNGC